MKLIPASFALLVLAACASAPARPPFRDEAPKRSQETVRVGDSRSIGLAAAIMSLDRATQWSPVSATQLNFDTHHPQGMVRAHGDWFVSSVEILRSTQRFPAPVGGMDRDAGEGRGHLFKLGADGALKADILLGEGDIYHPGGIDFDGRHIWVPVAEYRPDSASIIYRVDAKTLEAVEVFRFPDHIGAIVHDVAGSALVGVSWGAARIYRWPLQPDSSVSPADAANTVPAGKVRSHFIAWQDCHAAGDRLMLCTGLSSYATPAGNLSLGGAELIDLADFRPLWQTPILLWSPSGRSMTQNPAWFEASPSGLRGWFMPDDDASTLYEFLTPN